MAKCTALVKRGYSENEGPFVKALDTALQFETTSVFWSGIYRYPCHKAFIGIRVHKALRVNCAMHEL